SNSSEAGFDPITIEPDAAASNQRAVIGDPSAGVEPTRLDSAWVTSSGQQIWMRADLQSRASRNWLSSRSIATGARDSENWYQRPCREEMPTSCRCTDSSRRPIERTWIGRSDPGWNRAGSNAWGKYSTGQASWERQASTAAGNETNTLSHSRHSSRWRCRVALEEVQASKTYTTTRRHRRRSPPRKANARMSSGWNTARKQRS